MTRHRTARDDGRVPDRSRWACLGGHDKFKTWQLKGTEYLVMHCGHPTANYPWYGLRPDGSMITSGRNGERGYAFRYLDDAMVGVELDHAGLPGQIAISAINRSERSSATAAAGRRGPKRGAA